MSDSVRQLGDIFEGAPLERIEIPGGGSVELLGGAGRDITVAQAAWVSTAKRQKKAAEVTPESLARFIKYLAKHNHISPFFHNSLTFRLRMPVFVRAQFARSGVGIRYTEPCDPSADIDLPINEESRRYVNYTPEVWHPLEWRRVPDKSIKQGSGSAIPAEEVADYDAKVRAHNAATVALYEEGIARGIAPEMVRSMLPQAMFTELWCTMSLGAAARITGLRLDPHAQKEIRDYAQAISTICVKYFPIAWTALFDKEPTSGPV